MKIFRRIFFPAKPVVPEPQAPETEYMQVRVDEDTVTVTLTMQEFAGQIVNNPAWEVTCKALRQIELMALVTSLPESVKQRETCYLRLRAIDDITLALENLSRPNVSKAKPTRLTKP